MIFLELKATAYFKITFSTLSQLFYCSFLVPIQIIVWKLLLSGMGREKGKSWVMNTSQREMKDRIKEQDIFCAVANRFV